MTGQSSLVPHMQPYASHSNVCLANGNNINITHTSNIPICLRSSNLHLPNAFFPPDLRKNLLFIARLTQDNLVFFVFAPHFYQIYDLLTNALLFQDPVKMAFIL